MSEKTIADQVDEMGRAMAEQPANPATEVFAAEQQALRERGVPAGVAEKEAPLPDAELLDATGTSVTLSDALGSVPAVVVFSRGVWCPYCNLALATYQCGLQPALAERGAVLVAISPQRLDGSLSVQAKHDLSFRVLSDPGNTVAGALGITVTPGDDVLAAPRAWPRLGRGQRRSVARKRSSASLIVHRPLRPDIRQPSSEPVWLSPAR
ncbi:peroxiredoxin-like family protein [Actinomadura darangshiensis]|nr:peroxiredoxin-like family protein [Actinomadura darangshiensis]